MAKLSRNNSGRWAARKVIPEDIRAAYGKREEKVTWPPEFTEGQAKAAYSQWIAEVENKISALRLAGAPPETSRALELSRRDSRALAGTWYADLKARYEANPGEAEGWRAAMDEVIPEETAETYGLTPEEAEAVPLRVSPWLRREAEALLQGRGLRLAPASSDHLLQDMADLFLQFTRLMVQRAEGDWSPDPLPTRLPEWQPPTPEKPTGPTITSLFDAYVAERKPAEGTTRQWRRNIANLVAFLGHEDAGRVTKDDVVRWKDKLLATPTTKGGTIGATTVQDAYLAAAKAVFQRAVDNGRLADNPFSRVKVRGPKKVRKRAPSLTDAEAQIILSAALAVTTGPTAKPHELARRWVPWICAYTGARVNEITQLRKQDVVQREGVWALLITPEAGTVKTQEARWVPLHSHLIEQGFLEFVQGRKDGPLFYVPRAEEKPEQPAASKRTGERLASWVRSIGVDDLDVAPNHGWRHRFKTTGRRAGMDQVAGEVIAGHKPRTEGEAYGDWPIEALSREIEKLPRYEVTPAAPKRPSGDPAET